MNTSNNDQQTVEKTKMDQLLRKVRSDSTWNALTFEQCAKVEKWLFEENMGLEAAAERVRREFAVATSARSVGRFYRHRARVRQAMELLEAQVASDQLSGLPARTEDLRATTIKLLAKTGLRLALEKPDAVELLGPVVKLLLESQEQETRLRRVKLEERYYDFKSNAACAKDLEKVRAYVTAVGDNGELSDREKLERVAKLLFGREEVEVQKAEEAGNGA